MKRPRLNILSIKNEYNDVLRTLNVGDLFVAQAEDGLLIMFENNKNIIKGMMINPKNYKLNGITTWETGWIQFHDFYNTIFSQMKCDFFGVETQGHSMYELSEGLVEALTCMKTGKSFGNYRIRPVD